MIQRRRMKIEEVKRSLDMSQEDADREIACGIQVFAALKDSVERRQVELIEAIKEKQRKTEKQIEAFIKKLEHEISELKRRSTEVVQLTQSEDHLYLVQNFLMLPVTAPHIKDWTGVSISPTSYEGTVMRAVKQMEELLSDQMKTLLEVELKRVQQYAVDVTIDPDTANNWLILSDDLKQVRLGDVWRNLPNNPERFDTCVFALGKESFSSGKFYYEVQVKGATEWDLGVARESVSRKGQISLSPKNGFWTIWLRNENEYRALAYPSVSLPLKSRPERVGVFVDYKEAVVSFYDVDAAVLMYSFTGCSFNDKLCPFFSLCLKDGGKNSAPLTITSFIFTE